MLSGYPPYGTNSLVGNGLNVIKIMPESAIRVNSLILPIVRRVKLAVLMLD